MKHSYFVIFNLFAYHFRECYSEAECTWCEYTDLGQHIATPCCRLKEDCYFGKTTQKNRDTCGMCYQYLIDLEEYQFLLILLKIRMLKNS